MLAAVGWLGCFFRFGVGWIWQNGGTAALLPLWVAGVVHFGFF